MRRGGERENVENEGKKEEKESECLGRKRKKSVCE